MHQYFKSKSDALGLLLTSLIFVFTIQGCDEKKQDLDFTYPLTPDNEWTYLNTSQQIFYVDSTGGRENLDTLTVTYPVSVRIVGTHIIADSIPAYEMIEEFNIWGDDHLNRLYYSITPEALYSVAFQSEGGSIAYPKGIQNLKIQFHGQSYENSMELVRILKMGSMPNYTADDSIYTELFSSKVLEFPFHIGNQWVYHDTSEGFRMDRRVESQVSLVLESGRFDCYQTRTLYDLNRDDQWDNDILFKSYFAREGLVQRELGIYDMLETDEFGMPTGRKMDWLEKLVLTDFNLNDQQ